MSSSKQLPTTQRQTFGSKNCHFLNFLTCKLIFALFSLSISRWLNNFSKYLKMFHYACLEVMSTFILLIFIWVPILNAFSFLLRLSFCCIKIMVSNSCFCIVCMFMKSCLSCLMISFVLNSVKFSISGSIESITIGFSDVSLWWFKESNAIEWWEGVQCSRT